MKSEYIILDSGNGQKLEKVGPYTLVRPAAGAVWRPSLPASVWQKAHATFKRFSGGDGEWSFHDSRLKKGWSITISGIKFKIQPTDFGHIGIFPEQWHNWSEIGELVSTSGIQDFSTLNLFAYTGGSTLAAALGGSRVTHVDASKTSVAWARDNAQLNSNQELPIRWIVDDVQKYVQREVKRGSKYHGIILDPPSFGRGTKNEMWKIEDHAMDLLDALKQTLHENFKFVLLSSHSQGYTPIALENMLKQVFGDKYHFTSTEMILPMDARILSLPTGASSLMVRR